MSRSRPYAAGRVAPPTATALAILVAAGKTDREIADAYETTPRVVASWRDDLERTGTITASVYAPDVCEIVDEATAGLAEIVTLVRADAKHSTGKERIAAGDFLLRVRTQLGLAVPEREEAAPDLDRELADFLRATQSTVDADALRN